MRAQVEQIKERLDIVDVISTYIKVEKSGVNYKARCPFHNEKTPSFYISTNRQTFYCFGCQEKGDIFTFVEKIENVEFKDALKTLAEKAGVELQKFGNDEIRDEENQKKDRLYQVLEEATLIFEENLRQNKNGVEYLKKRGLSEEGIKKWRIGYAKDEWRNLHDSLLAKNFSRDEILEAGLIKKIDEGDKYYDTFRDRIIFPICDSSGKVIAFSGRTLKFGDDKTPKYLNSPETKLFYKSEVLYGWHHAKASIRKLDYAILVEGQMDLVMSHEAGVPNTVASSGTALTILHLKKIQKLSNRIILAYDSDSAGLSASRRAALLAMSLGMEVKIATLDEGDDPADLIKKDSEKWKSVLRESINFIDFALEKAIEDNTKGERNLTKEIMKNVLPLVSLVRSEIEKSQFIKKIAMRMRVPEEAVRSDLLSIKNVEITSELSDVPKNQAYINDKKVINLERMMAGIIFLSNEREKWEKLVGKDRLNEILEEYEREKEALLFEAESYGKEAEEDIMRRIEIMELKRELQKVAMVLDDKNANEEEEKEARRRFGVIQERIKELTN